MARLSYRTLIIAVLALGACNAGSSTGDEPQAAAQMTSDGDVQAPVAFKDGTPIAAVPEGTYEIEDSFIKRFADGHDRRWFKADFAYSGPVQRAGWEADHIIFDDEGVDLLITRERKEMLPFTGAEYQRRGRYHFGRYEVVMRAARGSGLVSSFFTHTGPSQNGDPHDEVDIEFLGHRTEELHINYFTAGRMAGSVYIQLPYDAADEMQLYAFEWDSDEIRWFVGDQLVYTATHADHPIPQTPSRLIMNLWTGSPNQYAWHGRPTFQTGATARYLCASYVNAGDTDAPQCSDTFSFDLPPVDLED